MVVVDIEPSVAADVKQLGAEWAQGGDDAAAGTFWADRWVDIAGFPFVARWVDIPQVTRPPSSDDGGAEPSAAPRSVVLMCIAFVLMIGTIEMLFGGTIFARRSDDHY